MGERFNEISRTIGALLAYVLGGLGCYRAADLLIPIVGLDVIIGLALFCVLCFSISKIPSVTQEHEHKRNEQVCKRIEHQLHQHDFYSPYSGKRLETAEDLAEYLDHNTTYYPRELFTAPPKSYTSPKNSANNPHK